MRTSSSGTLSSNLGRSSSLTPFFNNAFDLKEFGINRWEPLQINPQDNCIEPFRRLGVNTVLDTLDKHSKCELPTK